MNPFLRTFRSPDAGAQRRNPGAARIFPGFTLLELLISLSIFALISAIAYGGLNSVISTQRQTEIQTERLARLQTAMRIMARDIGQAVKRSIRDEFGDPVGPLIGQGIATEQQLEITRSGWRNPAGLARSELQRVAYGLQEDRLMRASWIVLDRAQDSVPAETELLSGVEELSIRYLDDKLKWHTEWPPAEQASSDPNEVALPKALEITLKVEYWGEIRRLLQVHG